MERDRTCELEEQTSINELLGAIPIQMVLPIYVQLGPGEFRCLS